MLIKVLNDWQIHYCLRRNPNVEKCTDELADKLLSEKKSSTKNDEKGTDKLADMLLMEKKYSTFDVDKCTEELTFMKQKLNTIHRKGLDQFEGQ